MWDPDENAPSWNPEPIINDYLQNIQSTITENDNYEKSLPVKVNRKKCIPRLFLPVNIGVKPIGDLSGRWDMTLSLNQSDFHFFAHLRQSGGNIVGEGRSNDDLFSIGIEGFISDDDLGLLLTKTNRVSRLNYILTGAVILNDKTMSGTFRQVCGDVSNGTWTASSDIHGGPIQPPPPSVLGAGESIDKGLSVALRSPNGLYDLRLQNDGDLVLYKTQPQIHMIWNTGTTIDPKIGDYLVMHEDGLLILFNNSNVPIWQINIAGNGNMYPITNESLVPNSTLEIQDDGNLVVYSPTRVALWSTQQSGKGL